MRIRKQFGSYYRTPAGRWRVRIWLRGRCHSENLPSEAAARRRLQELNRERLDVAARRAAGDVTYQEVAGDLRTHYLSRGLRSRRKHTPRALREYLSELGQVLAVWGPRKILDTRRKHVDEYVQQLEAAGLATATIRNRLDRLSQLVQVAVRKELIDAAPCEIQRPRIVPRDRPRRISERDLEQLLDGARRHKDRRPYVVLVLCADAGLRAAEVARLRVGDVDLTPHPPKDHGLIRVATEGEQLRTKSARGRTVPILTMRLAAALGKACENRKPGERVIGGVAGERGVTYQATKVWEDVLEGDAKLHQLRRRFASQLADDGQPLPKIQQWMGHASIVTTQRYVIVDPTAPANAGRSLEG